ncbi:Gfo/Idh/MocA family oxidoreductase [Bacillus gobiensis]|uniref:Gfo/Idh/MocA family protein n=1 Tax=Bacillus gobiensis TaxID=1441095 RepID=UPI003D22FF8B
MSPKLKIGIIGAGGIARNVHIPNYLRQGNRIEIVSVCDVNEAAAKSCAEEFGIQHTFTSYEDMFRELDIDAVSVCTPNKFHFPATTTALEAGCHVLCEKPPAMTPEEAIGMAEVAKRKGKILMYGFHYRHSAEVEALKRFIAAGELGDIYAVRAHALRRRGIPGWGVFTNKELQGGGPLIDIGVHMLDTALYLMGYPEPDVVFGKTHQKLGIREGVGFFGKWDWRNFSIEDLAHSMITFKNGASLILETSFAANIEKEETMQVSLMGNQGGADVFPLKIFQERHETLIDSTPIIFQEKTSHELEVERFVDACLAGHASVPAAEQGVVIQKLIYAIYKSAEIGDTVKY